jgi:RNA polymerase sigma factor (TIGR02999 family)
MGSEAVKPPEAAPQHAQGAVKRLGDAPNADTRGAITPPLLDPQPADARGAMAPLTDAHGAVTRLLLAAENGDTEARRRLWFIVYDELRRVAHAQLARGRPAGLAPKRPIDGLQTTAIVHEAFLRLCGSDGVTLASRRHFFAAAAEAMRCILVDDVRRRGRLKRGGGRARAVLYEAEVASRPGAEPLDLLALDEALRKLEQQAPRAAAVVKHRFYAGLGVEETAALLEVSPRTVNLDWLFARVWLHREMSNDG